MNEALTVAVNALFLRPGSVGGSEIALRGLLAGLAEGGDARIRVFTCREVNGEFASLPGVDHERCATPARPRSRRILWEQIAFPGRVDACGADVLWNAGFTGPVHATVPQVTTVFDLQHLDHPEHFRPSHRLAWRIMVAASLRRSARIVCPSQFTAERLARRAGIPAERIRVVPLGVEEAFFDPVETRRDPVALRELGLDRGYLLCPSTTHPHKGHAVLARALARPEVREALGGRPLVLTGVPGFVHDRVLEAFRGVGLGEQLRVLGWVPRDRLRALYRGALGVVFPTTYEGFGLPVLEGLAAGTPLIASDLPVLREVGGEDLQWVPPGDADALARELVVLLRDPEGTRHRRAAARDRVRRYRWSEAARGLARVFREAASMR